MVWRLFRRRTALTVARAPDLMATITLRLADAEDRAALERLAALYDRPALSGPALLALVDGELQAALTLAGDRELMEPYLPTAGLVDLLALRAKQLEGHQSSVQLEEVRRCRPATSCLNRHRAADTKRTLQNRHARRLATHHRDLSHPDLQGETMSRMIARVRALNDRRSEADLTLAFFEVIAFMRL